MLPELWKEKVTQLEALLESGWDCPFQKKINLLKSPTSKLEWLYKNLPIRNSQNPNFNKVMELLKELVG